MVQSPILIIALGPTGSGKSALPLKVLNVLNISDAHFDFILIDTLVENNESYRNAIKIYIENKIKKYTTLNSELSIKQKLIEDLTVHDLNRTIEFFNKAYFDARRNVKCNCESEYTGADMSCDKFAEYKLSQALQAGRNVVFESTGESYPSWLFDLYGNYIKDYRYKIVIAYSVVELCKLIKRNFNRVTKAIAHFIDSDYTIAAPRLPDVQFTTFKTKVDRIIDVFNEKVINTTHNAFDIRILVFNNNSYDGNEVIYDSDCTFDQTKSPLSGFLASRKCEYSTELNRF